MPLPDILLTLLIDYLPIIAALVIIAIILAWHWGRSYERRKQRIRRYNAGIQHRQNNWHRINH